MGLPPQMSFKSPEFQQTIKHRLEISTVKLSFLYIGKYELEIQS
jgi:hypothetical protein